MPGGTTRLARSPHLEPPHLQLHLGAGIAAIGLLFAVAAQRGRGALARPWLWRCAMLAVLVDLVHAGTSSSRTTR